MRRKIKGLTLIELIVFIVVAGIFVPMAYIAFSAATKRGTDPELMVRTRFAVEAKMESLTSNSFAVLTTLFPSNQYTSEWGPDTGFNGIPVFWGLTYVNSDALGGSAGAATNYIRIKVYTFNPPYDVSTLVTRRTSDE
jgi:hypothetical protein